MSCRRYMLLTTVALAACLCVVVSKSVAQIPNPGFENWAGENPADWLTTNTPGYVFVQQTSVAHSGASAAEGNVLSYYGVASMPIFVSGVDGRGFPVNFRPDGLHGFYTFAPVGGDYLSVSVVLKKNGAGIGTNHTLSFQTTQSSYREFVADIFYANQTDVPDTAVIQFQVLYAGGLDHVGTRYAVDDLSWGPASDVKGSDAALPTQFGLGDNYPNPFNPTTVINYDVPASANVSLKVYDLVGQEVATLVNEIKTPGRYQVLFDAKGLASGVYLYRLTAGSFIGTRRMMLVK